MEILLILIALAVVFLVLIYNRLVALRQERSQAFADIDVQLRQRYDLIPNLIETVKGYTSHEKQLLEDITNARANAMKTGGMGADRLNAEGQLGYALFKLMAVDENYPDLKANQNFMKLQDELSDIENKIAAARRFFNSATSELNTAVEQFPAVLFAAALGFKKEPFFELDHDQRTTMSEPPKVSFE
jgi:LemA protein